jgi:hypothetical protein
MSASAGMATSLLWHSYQKVLMLLSREAKRLSDKPPGGGPAAAPPIGGRCYCQERQAAGLQRIRRSQQGFDTNPCGWRLNSGHFPAPTQAAITSSPSPRSWDGGGPCGLCPPEVVNNEYKNSQRPNYWINQSDLLYVSLLEMLRQY